MWQLLMLLVKGDNTGCLNHQHAETIKIEFQCVISVMCITQQLKK